MSEKEKVTLLTKKDLKITWFSGSGGGGQGRNKHMNCCRIHHPASGVTAVGQDHKERPSNQRDAFHRLIANPMFKAWLNLTVAKIRGMISPEDAVEKAMRQSNLKIEVKDERGRWTHAKN